MTGIPAAVALGIDDDAVRRACGLVISITGDVVQGREDQRAKYRNAFWSDVEVTVNGTTKVFTYEEFFGALGFDPISASGAPRTEAPSSASDSPTRRTP